MLAFDIQLEPCVEIPINWIEMAMASIRLRWLGFSWMDQAVPVWFGLVWFGLHTIYILVYIYIIYICIIFGVITFMLDWIW